MLHARPESRGFVIALFGILPGAPTLPCFRRRRSRLRGRSCSRLGTSFYGRPRFKRPEKCPGLRSKFPSLHGQQIRAFPIGFQVDWLFASFVLCRACAVGSARTAGVSTDAAQGLFRHPRPRLYLSCPRPAQRAVRPSHCAAVAGLKGSASSMISPTSARSRSNRMAAGFGCAPSPARRIDPICRALGTPSAPRPPKLWCLNLKMAYKPLIIRAVQNETAEVGV
jgi:hypothetical protein